MGEYKVYTVLEVAEMLGVTRRTIYNYIKNEQLQANKVVGKWIVTQEQLKEFIEGSSEE